MEENGTNWTNTTSSPVSNEEKEYSKHLKEISDYMAIFTLCLIMLAMGADIMLKQIWEHLRRPIGVAIGMLSQFFLMPLVGFSLIKIMNFNAANSISVLLLSCCPGGAVSNVFAYYVDGDLSLSVTMTSLSTLLALGFMPLNLWMYGQGVDTGTLVIPFANMATSLAYVTSPAAVGMIIKWKLPKVAHYVTKIGSIFGFLLIATVIIMQNVAYPDIISSGNWRLCLTVVIMPIVGLTLGYTLAWISRRDIPVRKTIAIECGVQNVAIAIGVIALSPFSFEMQKLLLLFPMMYGISMILLCSIMCSVYQSYKRFCRSKEKSDPNKAEKQIPLSAVKEVDLKTQVFTISEYHSGV